MFVNRESVPVTDDEGNTILIRPKMSLGVKNRVISSAMRLELMSIGATAEGTMDVGAYQTALLQENITGWHGPAFGNMPFTREAVLDLDPDEPLVAKVLEEINERNTPKNPQAPNAGNGRSGANSRKVKR